MVRKGSPVRVRQRALCKGPANPGFCSFRGEGRSSHWVRYWVRNRVRNGLLEGRSGPFEAPELGPCRARSGVIQLALDFPDETPGVVDYLTIAEAAARIRCHERTIRRAIDSGDLRAGRIRTDRSKRGVFRIRLADLHAWMYGDAP